MAIALPLTLECQPRKKHLHSRFSNSPCAGSTLTCYSKSATRLACNEKEPRHFNVRHCRPPAQTEESPGTAGCGRAAWLGTPRRAQPSADTRNERKPRQAAPQVKQARTTNGDAPAGPPTAPRARPFEHQLPGPRCRCGTKVIPQFQQLLPLLPQQP